MFYLNSTLNFGIPPVLVFQLEVYYKVDRLLTGQTAQPKGTTARWYSNNTSLFLFLHTNFKTKTTYAAGYARVVLFEKRLISLIKIQ